MDFQSLSIELSKLIKEVGEYLISFGIGYFVVVVVRRENWQSTFATALAWTNSMESNESPHSACEV